MRPERRSFARLFAPRVSVLVLVLVLGSGCAGEDGAEGRDAVPTWTVEEVARMGSVADPGTSFADVADVLASDSTVLVLEGGRSRVAVFGPEHGRIGDFAGPGDGPGELREPQELGVTGGELWVRDPGGARLETYSPAGEPRRSFRFTIPADSLGVAMAAHALLEDGTILAGPASRPVTGQLRGEIRYADYAKADAGGRILERIYRAELATGDAFAADVGGGRQIIGIHPIEHSPLVRPFPDGSGLVAVERYIAEAPGEDDFRLLVFDVDGARALELSIPYRPVPTDGWRERHIDALRRSARGADLPASLVEGLRQGMPARAFHPPVSELVAGMDGTIWLRREPVDTSRARWEVYDREGARLAAVHLPAGFQLRHASREELWGVETDELDVPYVVGMRLTR